MNNEQKKSYMKKRYFAPEAEIIEYNIDNIMLTDSIVYGGVENEEWEDGQGEDKGRIVYNGILYTFLRTLCDEVRV